MFAITIFFFGLPLFVFLTSIRLCPCSMSGEMADTVHVTGNELKILKVDDAVNTTFVCEVKNRIGIGRDQVTAIVRGELKDRKQPHTQTDVLDKRINTRHVHQGLDQTTFQNQHGVQHVWCLREVTLILCTSL